MTAGLFFDFVNPQAFVPFSLAQALRPGLGKTTLSLANSRGRKWQFHPLRRPNGGAEPCKELPRRNR
jgi:hypothetical protein